MILIHTGDLHLDAKMNSTFPEQKVKLRRQELMTSFRRVAAYGRQIGARGILIAGDFFDRSSVSKTASRTVMQTMEEFPELEFFYLRGNHDAMFSFAEEKLPGNLHLFSSEWKHYVMGKVRISGLELNEDNSVIKLQDYRAENGLINLLMLHAQMNEYPVGGAATIALKDLRGRGIRYLALGHVHRMAEGMLDDLGQYAYCGCLEARGFDEEGTHGIRVIRIHEETNEVSSEFVPFSLRELKTVTVDVTEITTTAGLIGAIGQKLDLIPDSLDSMIRLVLVGETEEGKKPDTELIRATCEDSCFALRIYDETREKIDYSAYEQEASLKGELVRILKEQPLSEEQRAAVLRTAVQALSGEELIV